MKLFVYSPTGMHPVVTSHCASVGRVYATTPDPNGGVIAVFPDGTSEIWSYLSSDSEIALFPMDLSGILPGPLYAKLSSNPSYGILATDTYKSALLKVSAARNNDPFFNPNF